MLCLVALVVATPGFALAATLPFTSYGANEGLPSAGVRHIARDSRGLLWFSTRGGLARFNGERFINYSAANGLPVPTINFVLESSTGTLWLATNGKGVCRLRLEALVDPTAASLCAPHRVGTSPLSNRVNVILEDQKGHLWVGTDNGLFVADHPEPVPVFREVDLSGSPSQPQIDSLARDDHGTIWVGTQVGLYRASANAKEAQPYVLGRGGGLVVALAWAPSGMLWVSTLGRGLAALKPPLAEDPSSQALNGCRAGGAVRLPRNPGEYCALDASDGLPSRYVGSLFQEGSERLWLGSEDGLAVYDGTRFQWLATGPDFRDIDSMVADLAGSLWFSCRRGVMKLARGGFVRYGPEDGLDAGPVVSMTEDSSGQLIAITRDWAVRAFRAARFPVLRPALPGDVVPWRGQGAFLDSTGLWWLEQLDGLTTLPGGVTSKSPSAVGEPGAHPAERLRADRLAEDSHHDIWMMDCKPDSECRVVRWRRATRTIERIPVDPALHLQRALAIVEAGDTMWFGLDSDAGLARVKDGRLEPVPASTGHALGTVTSLHRDDRGRLWVGSAEQGLFRVDHPETDRLQIAQYPTAQGLSSTNVRCITSDAWGRIYVGTAVGIDRVDPDGDEIRHYTTLDGLATGLLFTAFRDRTGALWFSTTSALSRLVPQPDPTHPNPPIWIDEVTASGVAQRTSILAEAVGPLTFEPNQNLLRIGFSSLNLGLGEGVRYQFKVDGLTPSWSASTDQRVLSFAGLPPGHYLFSVRAIGPNRSISQKAATVEFTVKPGLFQRGSVRLLALAVLAAGVYLAARYRLVQELERQQIKGRISADLHDELGVDLTAITLRSEAAGRSGGVSEDVRQTLEWIADTSRRTMEVMRDVVWALNPQQDHLDDLVQRVRAFAAKTEAPQLVCDLSGGRVHLPPELRRNAYLVAKEATHNALRHSGADVVRISLRVQGGDLVLEVVDNGIGFDPASVRGGHGLANMARRAREVGGDFVVDSGPGRGTRVVLRAPTHRSLFSRLTRRTRRGSDAEAVLPAPIRKPVVPGSQGNQNT
jgi:signal transduction histidine kinase/ligand-binding sensor domain-containing protein